MKHSIELTKEEIFLVRNALIEEQIHLEDMKRHNGCITPSDIIEKCEKLMWFFDSIYRDIKE